MTQTVQWINLPTGPDDKLIKDIAYYLRPHAFWDLEEAHLPEDPEAAARQIRRGQGNVAGAEADARHIIALVRDFDKAKGTDR